jgi:hypothetical protein
VIRELWTLGQDHAVLIERTEQGALYRFLWVSREHIIRGQNYPDLRGYELTNPNVAEDLFRAWWEKAG